MCLETMFQHPDGQLLYSSPNSNRITESQRVLLDVIRHVALALISIYISPFN